MKFGGSRPKLAPDPDLIRSLAKLLDETGLAEIDRQIERFGARQAALLDIGQGVVAIGRRLAHSEQI